MRALAAIWDFIAGESRLGPLAVWPLAFAAALALLRVPGVPGAAGRRRSSPSIIAAALAASVFERT